MCYASAHMQTAEEQEATRDAVARLDPWTVGAIGVLAYMVGNVLHEGLGHGGACLAVGGRPLALSSVYFDCSANSRFVMAAGTLMNLLAGALFLALGRLTGRSHPRLKFFFWIAMTVNLFTGTGYFLFSGIGGFGDWAMFIAGLGPQWAWRAGLIVVGAGTYLMAARISLLELRPLIGSDPEVRYRCAVRLSAVPYFAGGILMCAAGALNPHGMVLVLLSAGASTFGGTSGLMWTTDWLKRGSRIPAGPPAGPVTIARSWPVIFVACALAIAFILVLGPSIRWAH